MALVNSTANFGAKLSEKHARSVTRRVGNGRLSGRSCPAFTLIEVVLAIVIALGILVVLMFFYQQATNLRAQAIEETEQIAAARLIIDRITGELRTVRTEVGSDTEFVGTSNALQFVKTDVPSFSAWTGGALGRSSFPVSDLKRIRYRLELADGTNTAGLVRSEEPLVLAARSLAAEELVQTNATTNSDLVPFIPEIKFLQFRYWSGTNWVDAWKSSGAPEAVEVSLGPEAITNATDAVDLSANLFRRIIYVPGRGIASTVALATTNAASGNFAPETEEAP